MRLLHLCTLGLFAISVGCSSTQKNSKSTTATAASTTPAASTAASTTPAKVIKNEVACSRTGEYRTIEIENVQPKGCKVLYSKTGTPNVIASSSVGNTHCENVREKIKTNLTNAGFNCVTIQAESKGTTVVDAPAAGAKKETTNGAKKEEAKN